MANVRDVPPQKLLQSPGRFGAWLAGDLLGGAELEVAHSAMGASVTKRAHLVPLDESNYHNDGLVQGLRI